jgi:hypothetical protein
MTTPRVVARRTAKRLARTITAPTAALRSLPDFLIIGAQRAGTTSLFRYLCAHPNVVPPVLNKGIHYFDTGYDKGAHWYRSHFPTNAYRAWTRRRTGSEVLTGEGSPYYVFHPLGPPRVSRMLPSVRLILMLRDPVSRAYSQYQHEVSRGFETLSFEEALEREDERLEGEEERLRHDETYVSFSHQHHSYVARGRYAEQISRWWEFVPREQLLVVDSAEFFADPNGGFRRVLDFLELPPFSLPQYQQLNAHRYDVMSERASRFLRSRFAGPNRDLAELLGRELTWTGAGSG